MNLRRSLLKTGILTGGLVVAGLGASRYLVWQGDQRAIAEALLQLLENTDRARMLGLSLLAHTPGVRGTSLAETNQALLQELNLDQGGADQIGLQQLLKRMHARVREDFEQEDTVIVDGWMLSLTEARLCALSALYAKS